LQIALPAASLIESEVAVPPVICHARVADSPAVIVLGDAVKFNVNGMVTVTVAGAEVPPGPVAVRVYVVVELTGMPAKDPEGGSGPVSSVCGMAGVMVIEVAFVVAQVSVVLCPALTYVGFAVNCVTAGNAEPTTCTVTVWGALVPWAPFAVAV
jgi:hypothetical protein